MRYEQCSTTQTNSKCVRSSSYTPVLGPHDRFYPSVVCQGIGIGEGNQDSAVDEEVRLMDIARRGHSVDRLALSC